MKRVLTKNDLKRIKMVHGQMSNEIYYSHVSAIDNIEELEALLRDANAKVAHLEEQLKEERAKQMPVYDPDREYSKRGLWDIMERACGVMNQFCGGGLRPVMASVNELTIVHRGRNGVTYSFRNCFKFGNPIEAPEKGRIIIDDRGRCFFSSGDIHDDGSLEANTKIRLDGKKWFLMHWCDYLDRSHHSKGWKKEWEPEYQ